MRWQLGGNFEPVGAACKNDWPKCPNALVNYIWFEIVTDVIDCLTNETFLWRILAILLIFTLVVHLIYWQNRWTKEIKINKENLENLDFKIQDLELKMNILTYKAQYGTWPLTFFTRKNSKNNLQNIQLAFSKLDEENFWIKNLWRQKLYDRIHGTTQPKLSINQSHLNHDHTKCSLSSIKDDFLEERTNSTNEISSRKFVEKNNNEVNDGLLIKQILEEIKADLLKESNTIGLKLVKSSSENYLSLHARNVSLGRKRNTKNNSKSVIVRVLDKDLSGKKVKLSTRHVNKSKLLSPSKKVTSHLKIEENMSNLFCSELEDKSNVHETLCQIKEKLESLYIILQNYNNREFQSIISNMYHNSSKMNRGDSTLTEMSSNRKYEYNGSYSPEVFAIHSICNRISRNSHFPIQLIEHPYNRKYSATEGKTSRMRNTNIVKKVGISNTMTLKKQPNTNKEQVNKELSENHITTIKNCSVTTNTENVLKIDKANSTEISMESNSDTKTVTVLLQETLSYENKELTSQIESEETFNINKVENMSKQSESFDYSNWQNLNTHFEPKLLDMITEESSGSSMDKRSNTSISRAAEECNDLQSEELKSNGTNSHSIESTISKNRITAEQGVMMNDITDISHLDSILQIEESPVSNNTKNISMVRDCLDYQEVESITKAHELVIQSTDDDLKLQANLNSSTFTESDSDSSVNRLIDRLIESERKSKSVRSLSGSRSREDITVDSLNNLIDSHNFLESTHFENKDCNTEKFNYFEMQPNIIKQNFDIDNENRMKSGISETIENKVQISPESMTTVINMYINHETLTPRVSQNINNRDRKEGEMLSKSVSCTATINKSSQVSTDHIQSINSDSLVENENDNINMSVNKNCINFLVSNNTLQKNKNYQNKPTNKNEIIENGSAIDKHHFNDFCSNNYKLFTQELQVNEELSNQKSYGVINTINNISSSNDIDLSRELSKSPNSDSKCSQFASGKGLTQLFSLGLRSLDQNIKKKSSLKSFQRSSLKSNYDLNNFKQLKAKSYLNLASFEKTSPVQTHRRSKSYVTPRDISLNIKNNNIEKTSSSESLVFSSKSSLKGFKSETPRKYSDEKANDELEAKRENSFESLSHSRVSSSKSDHLVSPTTSFMYKQEKKKNDSLIDFLNDDYSNTKDTKIESSMETSLFSNKSASKSCIPILKIRMDGTKKNVDESYARSPLTMTTRSFRIEEKLGPKHENETENTGLHKIVKEDENLCLRNIIGLQYSGWKNHCTVNTQCIEDQYNVTCDESNDPTNLPVMKNKDVNPKNDEIININFLSSCNMQINNLPSQSLFPKKSNKETEVLVKPITLDTSTSVSDLSKISNEINQVNKMKAFKIPDELTKEEYITVLKMINENSEFKQLSNMDKLCSKLQWDLHR